MNVKSILSSAILASLTLSASASFAAAPTQAQVVEHYADIAHAVYADSRVTAQQLQKTSTVSYKLRPNKVWKK
ncbi:iron-regulated protein A, putative [Vibrio cholerae]|nr:insulin-cleaving metalloase outer membrane protein [Vibrio paracholerae 87395]KFD80861.1 putative insulin-cleaving metalloase outer membrane protein [Vibrio paracholerae]QAV05013.1 Iron-regulated protein A precursor [Vibrio cholerae]GHW19289.1 iron-regulated protein A, putative [Vibrio cholerae]GHW90105.1 iron-regulated protein A, putative [Vibrio cholerae]